MKAYFGEDIIGEVLNGTYRVTRKIATGGTGVVYEACHARLPKKRFAIKIINPSVAQIPGIYARFRREAEITAELGHPNIVNIIDFNEPEAGAPYMVMELLHGNDLATVLSMRQRLAPTELMHLMRQIGSALQAAHDCGVVHRDMKPENIFLEGKPVGRAHVKILDFGISKIQDSNSVLTTSRSVFGTPKYMSPEQAIGETGDIDARTDIFALGIITYRALAGVLPFEAPSTPGVIYKICHQAHEPICKVNPELPAQLGQVIDCALAKQKNDRYPRVDAFVASLDRALKVADDEDMTQPPLDGVDGLPYEPTVASSPPGLITSPARVSTPSARARPPSLAPSRPPLSTPLAGADEGLSSDGEQDIPLPASGTLPISGRKQVQRRHPTTVSLSAGERVTTDSLKGGRSWYWMVAAALGIAVGGGAMVIANRNSARQGSAERAPELRSHLGNPAAPAGAGRRSSAGLSEEPYGAARPALAADGELRRGRRDLVQIRLSISPPAAHVTLDDAPVTAPLLELERTGTPRTLRVTAPGFIAEQRKVVATVDQSISVTLTPERNGTERGRTQERNEAATSTKSPARKGHKGIRGKERRPKLPFEDLSDDT